MQIHNPYCAPFIVEPPRSDIVLTIIIPCHNEPDIIGSLNSLYDCDEIEGGVEVIVIINDSEVGGAEIKRQNQNSYSDILSWIKEYSTDEKRFYVSYCSNLPKKHAGVGLARKIAMDEAAHRFLSIGKEDGIIQCYDADCRCDTNLLAAVIEGFRLHQSASLGIYYEHPIEGILYADDIYAAIISYELHLRYYTHIQQYIGLPFAFQTIGSSMAVRVKNYVLQGGMNKRKAGEDFYFLQKFITLDQHAEINTTRVIPSPRKSDRVPFGTGKAVKDITTMNQGHLNSYNPEAFEALKIMLDDLKIIYEKKDIKAISVSWPEAIKRFFLEEERMPDHIHEIKSNTTNYITFEKRFYKWFNAFKLMKYLHFCRNEGLILDMPVLEASYIFVNEFLGEKIPKEEKELLLYFRKRDRGEL